MTDDIVTRLRDVGFSLSPYGDAGQNRVTVFQAVDEIERLREHNEYLKANVEMLLAEARAVRGE